ncbi:Poly(ADP-ribose) glycohydrolase 1 [Corchorus olitorius]|uniref:Poly(ADP-ribose) glycohydrolase 1 n=1 Tax=Corchorus olitorius TaxID=93759 RepID=A0A1R3H202_9ROSI|nr:Poly(ADP-ribose) glycohydrolase 1 [Corchorus olitorius]
MPPPVVDRAATSEIPPPSDEALKMQIASPLHPDADSGISTPRSAFQISRSRCIRTKKKLRSDEPSPQTTLNPPLLTPPPTRFKIRMRYKDTTRERGDGEE